MRPGFVHAVVLNWNRAGDTCECVRSVLASDYADLRCLVVDNGSEAGDVARIRAEFPEVQIIENGDNLGYAEGNNVGLRAAVAGGADYVLVLNNDAEVAPDCISRMVAVAQTIGDRVGVVGASVYDKTRRDELHNFGMSEGEYGGGAFLRDLAEYVVHQSGHGGRYTEVASAHGSVMLVSAAAIRAVGVFDPELFLMHEEADLCARMWHAGFTVAAALDAVVWHEGAATFGKSSLHKLYYVQRNNHRFLRKRLIEQGRGEDAESEAQRLAHHQLDVARQFVKDGNLDAARTVLEARQDALAGRFGRRMQPAAVETREAAGRMLRDMRRRLAMEDWRRRAGGLARKPFSLTKRIVRRAYAAMTRPNSGVAGGRS